ncbi:MAG: AraC family transcriptional regulator, partial [Prevotella sp.]|nr:AraC family transcriptional regulator [Prevotella sp.]
FAREMGASQSTLYNKLRATTGMNVSSFIRNIRMKAIDDIIRQQPDLRVSDLAYKVGFKDPKYFATTFKKEFGMQPKEYIEKMRS